jgi:rhomboid protease GluP
MSLPPSQPAEPMQPLEQAPRPVMVRLTLPTQRPWVTYIIMGLTTLVYLAQIGTQTLLGIDIPSALGVKANDAILAGQLWRLITPVLLHGSILHIALNMYALFIIGPTVERAYGSGRYLGLYLIGGFAGNVFSFLLSPNPSLGASTAIFGLITAQGVLIYQNRQIFGRNARSMLTNIVVVVVINLVLGLSPGIDNWGHLGGLIGGLGYAWFSGPKWEVEGIGSTDLHLVDRRSAVQGWTAAIILTILFSALAATKFFGL